jgi:hypothetical protein
MNMTALLRTAITGFLAVAIAACAAHEPKSPPSPSGLQSGAASSDNEFSAAWREGQHNERETLDGSAYVHEMVRWLGPALSDSQRQCGGRPKDMSEPVRLAVQLNLDGSVRKALINPSSSHWECVKEALAKKSFPAPPRDGFWTSGTIH